MRDLDQLFTDPQIIERAMVVALEHPIAGVIRQLGVPIKLGATPGGVRTSPPVLGQHTDAILRELGLKEAEIEQFKADGVV